MTAPRWTYFTRVLIIPLQLEGTAGGSSHFSKKRGGTWKNSLDPIFQPIGRLNHRISSRIWSTFWRVMMNTLAVRMKKRQPPGLCDNSQGYSQGGCGYQPGWSQCDLKLEIAAQQKRVNTSFYHLVFFLHSNFRVWDVGFFQNFNFRVLFQQFFLSFWLFGFVLHLLSCTGGFQNVRSKVTIDGIVYVVDSCLVKFLGFEKFSQMKTEKFGKSVETKIRLNWIFLVKILSEPQSWSMFFAGWMRFAPTMGPHISTSPPALGAQHVSWQKWGVRREVL